MTKDGSSVSSLSVPGDLGYRYSILNYNEGTFTYDGEPGFKGSDVVALYEGSPRSKNINDDSGDGYADRDYGGQWNHLQLQNRGCEGGPLYPRHPAEHRRR